MENLFFTEQGKAFVCTAHMYYIYNLGLSGKNPFALSLISESTHRRSLLFEKTTLVEGRLNPRRRRPENHRRRRGREVPPSTEVPFNRLLLYWADTRV